MYLVSASYLFNQYSLLALRHQKIKLKMTREFNVIIERDSDGYFVASVPSLAGCHTPAKSLDELMERIKEAIELCLEVGQA
ncbi:hypothetical protein NIES21_11450 [Anabaenopsis circularis NIES-21]|uniref:HicB-like antitoxin of toxin-antitoxin system domain-containing protein n=3 Tax=Nostocales TaxID=1161 RepID=A0A1Z4GCX6_9CYAN|nr:hypothetical protein NIES21_11450 [Anabaenopsis circularis NIES-21]GBE93244.1 hypothetical protein NCWK1_3005 [Nostoc cycadae WK-1]